VNSDSKDSQDGEKQEEEGRQMNEEETEEKRTMKTYPRNVTDISNTRIRRKIRKGEKLGKF
jgi:hypothetical protein